MDTLFLVFRYFNNNELKVKVNGYEYSQYIPVNPNTWYEVILSMNASSGLVFVEGNSTLSFTNNVNNIKDNIIRLGTNKDNTLSLNGYIERLGIAKEYLSSSEISNILEGNVDVVLRDEYDGIGRITSKHLFVNNLEFNKSYTYKSIDGLQKTSTLIETETLIDGRSQEYEYDAFGNVTKKTIKSSNNIVEEEYTYTYDTLFRLTEEEILTYDEDEVLLERLVKDYTYDENGNRLTLLETKNGVVINDYSYTYDTTHKDRLIRYNDDLNQEILIDISYEDSFYKPSLMVIDGENNNLTWQGRNLMSQDLYDVTYTYNSSGLRTSKQVNNVLTNYIYEGSKLIGKKVLENNVETTLIYNYDHHNKIMGLSINDKEYFYIKDILENIIGIIDQEGNVVVYYRYDAYEKLLQEDIKINNLASKYNDILYKGYVYDRESELYYLKSRYYSPRIGRFIIMDEVSYVNPKDINGLNLYAYCNNNPIMYYDPSGRFARLLLGPIDEVIKELQEDYNNYNRNNTDENVVYKAHYFSGYKGAIVIKHSTIDSSFAAFGTIFLNNNHQNSNSLNHEYGHLLQEKELGWIYYIRIAIPSMLNYYKKKKYGDGVYYSQPWEYDADRRSGVTRNYSDYNPDPVETDAYIRKKYGFGDWKHMFKCGVEYLKSEANWLYKILF